MVYLKYKIRGSNLIITTLKFQIWKINHEALNNAFIFKCMLAHEWITANVRLQVIHFRYMYTEFKICSYAFYYIVFPLLFFIIRCLKKDFMFQCQTLNDIFDCDLGTLTSCSEINIFISPNELLVFISLENLSSSQVYW
jgi:hypothetical protein